MYPKIIYVTNDIFLFCLSCSVFVVIVASLWPSSGAPNENIVQNHLNIALLNVF